LLRRRKIGRVNKVNRICRSSKISSFWGFAELKRRRFGGLDYEAEVLEEQL
jgi:hypothetical protein